MDNNLTIHFMEACKNNNKEEALAILNNCELHKIEYDKKDKDSGNTSFMYECNNKMISVIDKLIENLQNINDILHISNLRVHKKYYFNVNIRNNNNETILMLMCRNNLYEQVKKFVEYNYDIEIIKINLNLQDNNGNSAIMLAAMNKHIKCVQILLKRPDIYVEFKNSEGKTLTNFLIDICKENPNFINTIYEDIKQILISKNVKDLKQILISKNGKDLTKILIDICKEYPYFINTIYEDIKQFLINKKNKNKNNKLLTVINIILKNKNITEINKHNLYTKYYKLEKKKYSFRPTLIYKYFSHKTILRNKINEILGKINNKTDQEKQKMIKHLYNIVSDYKSLSDIKSKIETQYRILLKPSNLSNT